MTKIISKIELEYMQKKYEEQQKEIKHRLHKIIYENAGFGIIDQYSGFSCFEPKIAYYPSEFIRIVDKEKGIIEFREIAINETFQRCVLDLIIDGSE